MSGHLGRSLVQQYYVSEYLSDSSDLNKGAKAAIRAHQPTLDLMALRVLSNFRG